MLRFLLVAILLGGLPVIGPAGAEERPELPALIGALAKGSYDAREKAIAALAATGDPAVVPALEALAAGDLFIRKSDGGVVIARKKSRRIQLLVDPLTGDALSEASTRELDKIRVNNRLRRAIRTALGTLTLTSPDPTVRLTAAEAIAKAKDPDTVEALDRALETETVDAVRRAMERARAVSILMSERDEATKIEAVKRLAVAGDRAALAVLTSVRADSDGALREAADQAAEAIERRLALWRNAQNVWYGLSLGSVLFLAAIGLAITFGVMGVINMAHGEMVMLGAYTTFLVQETIRTSAPGLFDWSLAIALPLAFLVAGFVGLMIERGVIRFLYGRPLETLLATWGVSLILQQSVRSIFGPTNREVGNPSWMSGAFQVGELTVTNNRLWIVVFSLIVFVLLLAVIKGTRFGLRMRAVTQNRAMASAVGIRAPWVDAMTFALGSGIAGIAGVALSQIDNVSPNLGQGYIIDSFMVVVFGGVGNLWGTLVGAMTLGVVNKFLEPYAGAVLAKILVLVLIILFIQKRPRGLFALRGRAVEA